MPPWYYKMDAAGRLTGLCFRRRVRPYRQESRACSIARMIAREFNDIATELMAPVQCGGWSRFIRNGVRQLVEELTGVAIGIAG